MLTLMIVDGERDGIEEMKIRTSNERPTGENDASKLSMLMRSLKLAGLRRGCMGWLIRLDGNPEFVGKERKGKCLVLFHLARVLLRGGSDASLTAPTKLRFANKKGCDQPKVPTRLSQGFSPSRRKLLAATPP